MNEIFGYCGWDFGSMRNNKFRQGEKVCIGRNIYRVVFRIGSWHLLKRIKKKCLTIALKSVIINSSNKGDTN